MGPSSFSVKGGLRWDPLALGRRWGGGASVLQAASLPTFLPVRVCSSPSADIPLSRAQH